MQKTKILVIILLAVFATACDSQSNEVTSFGATQSIENIETNNNSYVLLTNMYGMSNIIGTSNGAYEWTTRDDNGSNINFIDYASNQRIALCAQLNCNHNSETCNSFFSGSSGYLFLSENKTKIYCVKSAMGIEEPVERLFEMNTDGTNRRIVCELASAESFTNTVISQADDLFMSVILPDGNKSFRKINVSTGEAEELFKLKNTEWVFGAHKDKFIILSLEMNEVSGEYTYFVVDTNTLEKTAFYNYRYDDSGNPESSKIARYFDGNLYILTPTENNFCNVKKLNLETKEETILTSELRFFGVDSTDVSGVYDNKLIVSTLDNRDSNSITSYMYSIDCNNGEISELNHSFQYGALTQLSDIVAENDNMFLIYGDYINKEILLYDTAGVAYKSEVQTPTYRLITKSDYWSNEKNYRLIEDLY